MAIRTFNITETYDSDAGVWLATSEDIPGLNCEAETVDELREIAIEIALELLILNRQVMPHRRSPVPFEFRNRVERPVAAMA